MKSIMIYYDSIGLDEWINALTSLKASPDIGHVHKRSPLAGGETLNDQNLAGETAIGGR